MLHTEDQYWESDCTGLEAITKNRDSDQKERRPRISMRFFVLKMILAGHYKFGIEYLNLII